MKTEKTFNTAEQEQIRSHGLTEKKVLSQLEDFERGFPAVELIRPCTAGDGIHLITKEEERDLCDGYEEARRAGRCGVFVPASGAASRMFKALLAVYYRDAAEPEKRLKELAASDSSEDREIVVFISELKNFAFYQALKAVIGKVGKSLDRFREEGKYVSILHYLLTEDGLGYGVFPKGLVLFHAYKDRARTPFEEHLREASCYVSDAQSRVRLHFTVPVESEGLIHKHVEEALLDYERQGLRFSVTFSCQKPETDTVAVDMENRPFRDSSGRLVFRPAGHGALLENLSELKGDFVFIKNIDNVLPDSFREEVVRTQKLLGGFLLAKQREVFGFLEKLEAGCEDPSFLKEVENFCFRDLRMEEAVLPDGPKKREFLYKRLNRPLRVCGMVKNEGEPGGGPFWVRSGDGGVSRQIVERSQIDSSRAGQTAVFESATHFNPVNLVCGLRDFKGKPFDLSRFVDAATGFISVKSKDGRQIKALELPGLWNGAMAGWITWFVETPAKTFGPVKVVTDLLRDKHLVSHDA